MAGGHKNNILKQSPLLFSLFFLFLYFTTSTSFTQLSLQQCNSSSSVTPTTKLLTFLQRLQQTALTTFGPSNFDPKNYVDLSLKHNLSTATHAFQELLQYTNGSVSTHDLNVFIESYFNAAGSDVVYHEPEDFVAEPEGFLPKVKNHQVRKFGLEVHSLWKNLSRKVSTSVHRMPQLHTLLPLPNSMVIPGSRFREVYYWDSYWVIRGLLSSKMYNSAKAIVENLLSLIDTYGYVLNGARAYYTNRSQPPLLSSMIHAIYERTHDKKLVKHALPRLLKEYDFWNSDFHRITVVDAHGCEHNLSRYYARWNQPRPESSTTDKKSASNLTNASEKKRFYREVASSAESGWDFSTRWMRNTSEFTTLSTTSVLPVDLNAYVLKMELDITFLAKAIGDHTLAKKFLIASELRKHAFNSIFWNEMMGQWLDYWIDHDNTCKGKSKRWNASNQNHNLYASNFIPLWIELFNSDTLLVEKVTESLQTSGLVQEAGIATSLKRSGEQWDFPNGWAPLQHMIVEGLARSGSQKARGFAKEIAVNWVKTNYAVYKKTGVMHEKIDVEKCGQFGGGGEYTPQTGFGWSNGVVLDFLEEFGWSEGLKIECRKSTRSL
ncbi:hypothetical protein ACFE04_007923 [Oxalis oulophora]